MMKYPTRMTVAGSRLSRTFSWLVFIASFLCSNISLLWAEPVISQVDLRGMGYVTGIVAGTSDSYPYYVRTDVGGAYRWDDSKDMWIPITNSFDENEYYGIESIAVDPSMPGRIFIACGMYLGDSPDALFRSDDFGETWNKMNLPGDNENDPLKVDFGGNEFWRRCGERIAVDPKNSDYVYMGTRTVGLFRSVNEGLDWASYGESEVPFGDNGGHYKFGDSSKPVNGGVTWVVVDPTSEVGDPIRSAVVYAGVMGEGVFRSIDGGESFHKIDNPNAANLNPIQGRIASDGRLYVTYTADRNSDEKGAVCAFVNGTWSKLNVPQPEYWGNEYTGLGIHPTNPNKIVVGAFNNVPSVLYYSDDGGQNWAAIHQPTITNPSWIGMRDRWSYCGAILFEGEGSENFFLTTGYGVYRASNIDPASVSVELDSLNYMKGLEEHVVVHVGGLPEWTDPDFPEWTGSEFYALTLDSFGFLFDDEFTIPDTNIGDLPIADGFDFVFCRSAPENVYALGADHYRVDKVFARSVDGGKTWEDMVLPSATHVLEGGGLHCANGSFAVSATDPDNIVYIPAQADPWYVDSYPGVAAYSTDGGQSWNQVAGLPIDGQNHIANGATLNIVPSNVLVSDSVNGSNFYMYVNSGDNYNLPAYFYRSTNGGSSFQQVNTTDLPTDWRVDVIEAPDRELEVWVSFPNTGRLFYTLNGGDSFTKVGGLDHIYLATVGLSNDPGASGAPALLVYGDLNGVLGLYKSENRGLDWELVETGEKLPIGLVSSLGASLRDDSRFYVGTGGHGLYVVDLDPEPEQGPVNLFADGGFENSVWTTYAGRAYQSSDSFSGGFAMYAESTDGTDPEMKWSWLMASGGFWDIVDAGNYRLVATAKVSGGGVAELSIADGEDKYTSIQFQSPEWETIYVDFTVPENPPLWVSYGLLIKDFGTSILLDDIALYKDDGSFCGPNLFGDGDFESSGWTIYSGYGGRTQDSERAGTVFEAIGRDPNNPTLGAHTYAASGLWQQLEGGKDYRLSVDGKIESESFRVILGANGIDYATVEVDNVDWQTYTAYFKAPADVPNWVGIVLINEHNVSARIDNVEVVELFPLE